MNNYNGYGREGFWYSQIFNSSDINLYITPEDIPDGLKLKFVFINSCNSGIHEGAIPALPNNGELPNQNKVNSEFIKKFNATTFMGWKCWVNTTRSTKFAQVFFKYCDVEYWPDNEIGRGEINKMAEFAIRDTPTVPNDLQNYSLNGDNLYISGKSSAIIDMVH